jgi:Protein of unknown function (DUF2914)
VSKLQGIAFFVAGFVFDMLMLGRIDSWHVIGQQIVYLVLITLLLLQMLAAEDAPPPAEGAEASRIRRLYFKYRPAAVNFFLGTLLNVYTIFFFKSSSLLVSFAFMAMLVLLLLANEAEGLKKLGLSLKFALLSLCFLCFAASVIPVFVGFVGLPVFVLSMAVGCLPLIAVGGWIRMSAPEQFARARRQIFLPLGAVVTVFMVFYLFRLVPPVPLSIPFIGVYHTVERTPSGYRLIHENPHWRWWHNGDQTFLAQPGDKVYVFFRVFSPTRFSDQVLMRWYRKDSARGWMLQDSIPIKIVGGREEGFRGYGFKASYQPGDWKVQIETNDGREIGRIYFELESVPEAPRAFHADLA